MTYKVTYRWSCNHCLCPDKSFRFVKRYNFTEVLAGTVFAIEEKYRLALHPSSSRWKASQTERQKDHGHDRKIDYGSFTQ